MQDEVNQEESEQDEDDRMKNRADSLFAEFIVLCYHTFTQRHP